MPIDPATQHVQFPQEKEGMRQRTTARRSSFVTDPSPSPGPNLRRTSSIITDSSFESYRRSVRSPTEEFFHPKASGTQEELHQEPTLWHSLPVLALAILPSIGGVFFKKGSIILTDLALLVMAAIYLNWVLITPWTLYHDAQTINVAKPPILTTIDEEGNEEDTNDTSGTGKPLSVEENTKSSPNGQDHSNSSRESDALRELQLHELFALAMCFAGPLIGAYILHVIRTQISRFGDEMVSNLHLTLFVLGAEIRPIRHSMKLIHARTLHLQRLVREDPHAVDHVDTALVQELMDRVNAVESNVAEVASKSLSTVDQTATVTAETVKKAQNVLQTQVDALNRAVRRYEKRATAQTIQNESRLQDLEARLKDALSLAAAAANYSQNNGNLGIAVEYLKRLINLPIEAILTAIRWPLQIMNTTISSVLIRLGVAKPPKRKKVATKQSAHVRLNHGERPG